MLDPAPTWTLQVTVVYGYGHFLEFLNRSLKLEYPVLKRTSCKFVWCASNCTCVLYRSSWLLIIPPQVSHSAY